MKYLVTGGAGFIGSHIVDRLLQEDNQVIVVDNLFTGNLDNLKRHSSNPNFIFHKRDIREDLEGVLDRDVDAVFHLAAIPTVQFSIENPREVLDVGDRGTLNLLESCRKQGIKRFVFTSSASVYGDQETLPFTEDMELLPNTPYATSKSIGEALTKIYRMNYGMEVINLRPFNVYGPRQNTKSGYALFVPLFIDLISKNQTPTINGDGNQTRDYVYVEDVVEANLLAATTTNRRCFGESFNVGTGTNLSINEISDMIVSLSGKDVTPVHGPAVQEQRDAKADVKKSYDLLAWQPKVSFEKGLQRTYNWFTQKS